MSNHLLINQFFLECYNYNFMIDLSSPDKKSTPLNHTKKLGTVEFIGYLKSQPETVQIIFSLQKYLQNYPPFYLNAFLSTLKGQSIEFIKNALQNEYKVLLQGRSFIYIINNAIQARKKCINKIRRDITKSTKFLSFFTKQYHSDTPQDAAYIEWVEMEGYSVVEMDETIQQSIKVISNIFVDMTRLRDMTMYIVDEIHRWRVAVQEHLDRCQQHSEIKFFYDQQPIYQILLKDITFIWNSKLSQYIWLQAKQDPFLIRNVILVQQREKKTLLQKYFVEVMYPKDEKIVDKALQCFEMLVFKYKPKLYHRFEEEELLIQNYLKMEMNEHQFDEDWSGSKMTYLQQTSSKTKQMKIINEQKSQQSPRKQKNELKARGWVFERQIKKNTRERINQILQNHKHKKGLIQPFNISNYSQKNSIALAYLSEVKAQNKRQPRIKINSAESDNQRKNFFSEGEDTTNKHKQSQKNRRKGLQSQPERVFPQRKTLSEIIMFRSLTKLSPVILQDPKQHLPDTPKAKQSSAKQIQYKTANELHPSLHNVKLNSFAFQEQEQEKQTKIEIDEQQTPLNLNKFYQIFRADTMKAKKIKDSDIRLNLKPEDKKQPNSVQKQKSQKQKFISFKQLLDRSRKQRANRYRSMTHLPYVKKNFAVSLGKKKIKQKSKQKTLQKSHDSYKQYSKIKPQNKSVDPQIIDIKKVFLTLQAKSIPLDLVGVYIKHLQTKRPIKSKIFTEFSINHLITKLTDPFVHSIIFNINTEQKVPVGTIVLSQALGGRAGRLKYMVEYMSIQPFQLVSIAMLRVAEQLLSATPCQEVVYPLRVDRLDIVSSQFIDLIDADLSKGVQKFGQFMIMQKPKPSLKNTDVRQRIYVFTSPNNMKKQYQIGLKMMGNYRSLKFDCKCIVLTSNFRLRSQNLFKNTLSKYEMISIGELYAKALTRIMTKYHLKQLSSASYGGQGQTGEFVRKDSFLRAVMNAALRDLINGGESLLKTTAFGTMQDLLNYLRYKNLDYNFQLQFLNQSRFILQHQLILVELDHQLSLQFTLTSNQQLYILHNFKNHQITQINCSKIDIPAFLLPTTSQKIKLFLMSATHHVESTTDQLDLYSYLSYFFKNQHSQIQLSNIPSIVIPNLKNYNIKINKVRMYDGFFKLFPQREFYSAAMLSCSNYWESYYSDAVMHLPVESSIVLDYPLIMGFYESQTKTLLSSFLYNGQGDKKYD